MVRKKRKTQKILALLTVLSLGLPIATYAMQPTLMINKEETFTNLEEAKAYYDTLTKEQESLKEEVKKSGGTYNYEVSFDIKTKEPEKISKTVTTIEEVENLKKELENSGYVVTKVSIIPNYVTSEEKETLRYESLASAEEALKKLQENEALKDYEIKPVLLNKTEEVYLKESKILIETEKDAYLKELQEKVDALNKKVINTNTEYTLESSYEYVESEYVVIDSKIIKTESKEYTFGTQKEAEEKMDALKETETEDFKITYKISKHQKEVPQDKETITESFDTEAEALAYLEKLKKDSYKILSYKVEEKSYEEMLTDDKYQEILEQSSNQNATWGHLDISALQDVYVVKDKTEEKVEGDITLKKVLINNKEIKMSSTAKKDENGGLKLEFNSKDRWGLKIKNNSYIEIEGTISYTYKGKTYENDLSVKGYLDEDSNRCLGTGYMRGYDLDFEKIQVNEEGKVIVKTNIKTRYSLSAEIQKVDLVDEYLLETEENTYELTKREDKYYQVDASILEKESIYYYQLGYVLENLEIESYQVDIETEEIYYVVSLNGEKIPSSVETTNKEENITQVDTKVPNTSYNSKKNLYGGLSILSLGGLCYYVKKKHSKV